MGWGMDVYKEELEVEKFYMHVGVALCARSQARLRSATNNAGKSGSEPCASSGFLAFRVGDQLQVDETCQTRKSRGVTAGGGVGCTALETTARKSHHQGSVGRLG